MSRSLQALLDSLAKSPGLALLAVIADSAVADTPPGNDTLMAMRTLVSEGALNQLDFRQAWPLLERGLMGSRPSRLLSGLDSCGALPHLLPEVAALSGSYQMGADGEPVDIAAHLSRLLDLAATQNASLRVRVAALLCNLGKVDSPPQHLPTHYLHIDRCLPRIRSIALRFGLPQPIESFAILATQEMERVHRATRMRADALTALLERVDAFAEPERFNDLLTLCTCDWGAYPGQETSTYPKAALLRQAMAACQAVDATMDNGSQNHESRSLAVAAALHSCRQP
ncbi:MAG: tRNA nucleotidyltransferase [Dechloromonas sp.]|uniref:tRNA nucleotidyltransferase n=1 Tax=Candidatus Dechloromonas phosphorivorans TaxID=2899244 RepID=A0A935K2L3_9RHOO|nr:tRNA nucleotidyltransferase [Candidatus Dechloromonas phosphorivorans]